MNNTQVLTFCINSYPYAARPFILANLTSDIPRIYNSSFHLGGSLSQLFNTLKHTRAE